jgi:hypothetical protein
MNPTKEQAEAVYLSVVENSWKEVADAFNESAPMRRLAAGDLSAGHYKVLLGQMYQHFRESPRIIASSAGYLRGDQRLAVSRLLTLAAAMGEREQVLLDDLVNVGCDVRLVPFERPLPATAALIAFPYYQLQYVDPLGHFGYHIFLEKTLGQHGDAYAHLFSKAGVPEEALRFLRGLSEAENVIENLMSICAGAFKSLEDADSVAHVIRVTGELYAGMIRGAFDQADAPKKWGMSVEELKRRGMRFMAG